MSLGSIEDVVFIDQVNLSERGLLPSGPTGPPGGATGDSALGSPLPDETDDRWSEVTDLRKNLL